jgi:DNA-directed RNA polymerase subunit RPC12/RpoP
MIKDGIRCPNCSIFLDQEEVTEVELLNPALTALVCPHCEKAWFK